jgi:hypothetical protein
MWDLLRVENQKIAFKRLELLSRAPEDAWSLAFFSSETPDSKKRKQTPTTKLGSHEDLHNKRAISEGFETITL